MRLGPPPEVPEIPGQFWIDFIRDTAPVFRKSTLEQLGEFIAPTFQALIDGAKYVDPRLAEIIDELGPDVIVEDNVVGVPGPRGDRAGRGSGSCRATRPRSRTRPSRRSRPGTRPRTGWLAGLPRGGPSDPRRHVGRLRRLLPRARRARPVVRRARAGLHGRVPVPQPATRTRPRPTTPRERRSARRGTASTRRSATADTTWELPEHLRERRRCADLPVPGLASAPPTSG